MRQKKKSAEFLIEGLWILNNSGICLFQNYVDFTKDGISTDLISSFLSAILSFARESFADEIQHIQFSNRKVLFQSDERVLFVIAVADEAHVRDFQIKKIIKKISKKFNDRFESALNKRWDGDCSKFDIFSEDLKKIVKKEPLSVKFFDFKEGFKKFEKFLTRQTSIFLKQKDRVEGFFKEKKSLRKIQKLLNEKNKLEKKLE